MPSGKIISFLYGELSPALRFKTNLVAYATGLYRAFNNLIRKAGGSSNRSGFQYVTTPTFQDGLEEPGRVRIFGLNLELEGDQAVDRSAIFLIPSETGEQPEVYSDDPNNLPVLPADRDLENVKVSQEGDIVIFSNGTIHWAYKLATGVVPTGRYEEVFLIGPQAIASTVPAATSVAITGIGTFLGKPVHYLVYQVLRDGGEVFFASFTGVGALEPVLLSAGQVFTSLDVSLSSDARVKHYNVYRSAVDPATASRGPWGLVGRIPKPAVDGVNRFHDYITEPDFLNPPPDEDYLYGDGQGLVKEIKSARLIAQYQQRRLIVINPSTSQLPEGSVACSRIGVPNQFDTQVIFKPTGAFDFRTPLGVRGRIVGVLEMERLILLTEEAAVIVRGGQNGILTPETVNPDAVTYEGCSERVTPVKASQYGFFMSKNEEKLMRVQFTVDGNVSIDEVSLFSDHLVSESKINQMALTKGSEDILWLLNDEGKLVSISLHQGGQETGWARHEVDGFVESITALTVKKQAPNTQKEVDEEYDALYICVVRDVNGTPTRLIERLAFREDRQNRKEQWFYADSYMYFGSRLRLNATKTRYVRDVYAPGAVEQPNHVGRSADHPDIVTDIRLLNITGGVNWDENEDLTVSFIGGGGNFQDPNVEKQTIDFYYENSEGVLTSIRWVQNGFTSAQVASGRFQGTVPEVLRDVEGQAISTTAKTLQQSRWIRVKRNVSGLAHLAGKDVSIFADGAVISSPLNANDDTLTIDGAGNLDLGEDLAWGYIGIPYVSELETLDIDTSDGRTLTSVRKLITVLGVALRETKGGFFGGRDSEGDISEMSELLTREDQSIEELSKNENAHVELTIPNGWEKTGRIIIKQVDPLPMTVLSVYPKGISGD